MKSIRKLTTIAILFAALHSLAKADQREAEDVAYRMAQRYIGKSFQMAPTDHAGLLGAGQAIRFLIPVTKGLDYVFLCGGDELALDIDIIVQDEVGNTLIDDRRNDPLAGVQFRAGYNGTAIVYLHMARADGLGAYCVLVGRRGAAKQGELSLNR